MRFNAFSFGAIRIDGVTYEHDVVIDRGRVRKRKKKPSKKFHDAFGHTPLSIEEDIPWKCQRLVIGTGTGALPVMKRGKARSRAPQDRIARASDDQSDRSTEEEPQGSQRDPARDLLSSRFPRRSLDQKYGAGRPRDANTLYVIALEQLQYAFQQGFPFRLCLRDLHPRMTFFQHGGEVLLARYFQNVKDQPVGESVDGDFAAIGELKDVPLGRFQHTENRLDFRRGVQLGLLSLRESKQNHRSINQTNRRRPLFMQV
jgi:hypothetical protein